MKKIIGVFLLFALLLTALSGCGKKEQLNRTTQISESGVITKTVFESIKENNDIGIFNGNSNDITYQWLFMGSLIGSPKDENLLVNFSNAKTEKVKNQLSAKYVQEFSFASKEKPEGGPTLSVYFAYPWYADLVEVYQYNADKNEAELIGTAALENAPNSIVTLIPQEYKGLFYLVGKEATQNSETHQGAESDPKKQQNVQQDAYTSEDKTTPKKDKYLTDPVPDGKPNPVEPEDVTVDNNKKFTATISIRCDTILNNMDKFNKDKMSVLPSDGVIMNTRTIVFYEGESVFDVLQREVKASKIHMEFVFTPMYNSAYIEGIHNLYEFDCGELSGWMYKVNGWFPNYGCSRYMLKNGDVIEWVYTCDLGKDVGGGYAVGE